MSAEKDFNEQMAKIGILILYLALGLLFAFPIKWCWNYAAMPLFGLPELDWEKAWCLYFLSVMLLKPIHYHPEK